MKTEIIMRNTVTERYRNPKGYMGEEQTEKNPQNLQYISYQTKEISQSLQHQDQTNLDGQRFLDGQTQNLWTIFFKTKQRCE